MTKVHVIAIQGELTRLRAEIKQLLSAYSHLLKSNATLDERKQLRSQIRLLMYRGSKLKTDAAIKMDINHRLYEIA